MSKKFFSYSLFVGIIFFYSFFIIYNAGVADSYNNKIKLCSSLNYQESLYLHPSNFGKFDLALTIHNERKWRKIAIKEELKKKKILEEEGRHYFYLNRERVKASFVLNVDKKLKCKVLAKIRIHGDLKDHRRGSGLPSINVNLTDGHIFGVVDFILFRPATRNYDNEIFTTTLLRELGFLAPRTSKVNIGYNNLNSKFIFQEKIVKEFLENSLQRESAIFEGDERFLAYDPYETINLSKHRLVNKSWARKGDSNQIISETALSILNEINQYHRVTKPNAIPMEIVDYYTAAKKVGMEHYFDKLPEFDSIMFAMEGEHNLGRDDRRFYYDPAVKKFYPIYYDGLTNLLTIDNRILNLPLANKEDIDRSYPQIRLGKITPSAVLGSRDAYKTFYKLKINNLYTKLKRNGINLKKEKIEELIKIIKGRLLLLNNFEEDRIFNVSSDTKSRSFMPTTFLSNKNLKRRLIYYSDTFAEYLSCDIYGNDCKSILLNTKEKIKSLAQELKDASNNNLIFVGKKRKKPANEGWFSHFTFQEKFSKNQIKKKTFSKNSNLITYGNVDFEINSLSKTVTINKNDQYGRIVFTGGTIDSWKIVFKNNYSYNESDNFHKKVDENGYTGCLSFFDIKIVNISIESFNSDCEDAVNFVRSSGSIRALLIRNSLYDGLDADFSSLKFELIDVKTAKNDCIDFSFGDYFLNQVIVESCGDKGVSIGETSKVKIENLSVSNSNIGLASKDFAEVMINKGFINTTKYCVEAYNKKQEFSGGFILANELHCIDSHRNLSVDNKSLLKVNFYEF